MDMGTNLRKYFELHTGKYELFVGRMFEDCELFIIFAMQK